MGSPVAFPTTVEKAAQTGDREDREPPKSSPDASTGRQPLKPRPVPGILPVANTEIPYHPYAKVADAAGAGNANPREEAAYRGSAASKDKLAEPDTVPKAAEAPSKPAYRTHIEGIDASANERVFNRCIVDGAGGSITPLELISISPYARKKVNEMTTARRIPLPPKDAAETQAKVPRLQAFIEEVFDEDSVDPLGVAQPADRKSVV